MLLKELFHKEAIVTGPIIPPGGISGGMPGAPSGGSPPTPKPPMASVTPDSPKPVAGGAQAMPAGGMPIPEQIGEQIDKLPPGSETAASLLKNPIIASIAAVPLSAMTGTPLSPSQVMMGAQMGSAAIKMRKEQKEAEADNSNSPRLGG